MRASSPPHLRLATEQPPPAAEPLEPAELFSRFSAYVAKIAYRILASDSDVDDVVQDVFAVAVLKRAQLERSPSPRLWLASVTVKRARQVLRWRRVRALWAGDAGIAYDEIADAGAGPELKALASHMYRALDKMPTQERLAWTLRHLEGESLEDVALMLGCSLATAKRRIFAAQSKLREVLDDDGQ